MSRRGSFQDGPVSDECAAGLQTEIFFNVGQCYFEISVHLPSVTASTSFLVK